MSARDREAIVRRVVQYEALQAQHDALRADVVHIARAAEDAARDLEREAPNAAGVDRLIQTLRATAGGLRRALGGAA